MTVVIQPVPQEELREGHRWREWFNNVQQTIAGITGIGGGSTGTSTVSFNSLDFSGSNITSILSRRRQDLQSSVTSIGINYSLTDADDTVNAVVTGLIVTLPAASTDRVGHTWTVILGVSGYVDVTVAGSDTFNLPTTDTTIRLDNKGASVTLRCISATSWSIV